VVPEFPGLDGDTDGTAPLNDRLEDFKKADRDSMKGLAKHGKAKVFEVRSIWRRKMIWRLRITHDRQSGEIQIVGVGQPKWADVK